jgi:hypothetical protein
LAVERYWLVHDLETAGHHHDLPYLAITFWITANSYWMISEFIGFDSLHVYQGITFKHLSLIPFLTGLGCLLYYYVIWQPRHPNELDTM